MFNVGCLMFTDSLDRVQMRRDRMSRCPYRTGLIYNLEFIMYNFSLCRVLGTSRTASWPCLMDYTNSWLPSPVSVLPLPLPPGVVGVVPLSPLSLGGVTVPLLPLPPELGVSVLVLSDLTVSTRRMVVSRLAEESSPVALARSFKPLMYFATVKSSFVGAPSLTFKPMEKMARSGNLTFLPKRRSSLVQTTASVKMPLMAPLENGVLWLAMCSANSSRPMVSSATTRGYHFW